ncbi:hypothetical protein DFJ77DRAFT_543678 [Powellomyces hirtus]|nr:hypothetical protein DFJ77DRAFT_543678 [Powellomyces hirtus]
MTVLLPRLYGGDISLFAQMNYWSNISPSKAKFVSVGAGTILSRSTLRPNGAGHGILDWEKMMEPPLQPLLAWYLETGMPPSQFLFLKICPWPKRASARSTHSNGTTFFVKPPRKRKSTVALWLTIDGTFIHANLTLPPSKNVTTKVPSKRTLMLQWVASVLFTWTPYGGPFVGILKACTEAAIAMMNAALPMPVSVPLTGLVVMYAGGIASILFLILASRLVVPRTKPSLDLATSPRIDVLPFIGGSWVKNVVDRLGGAHVGRGAMSFRPVLDGRLLSIGAGAVADKSVRVPACTHDQTVLAGESLVYGCTLAIGSEALFQADMGKQQTGVWMGMPARGTHRGRAEEKPKWKSGQPELEA